MASRGGRSSGSLKGGRKSVARRGHGGPRLNRRLGGHATFARSGTTTPYGPGTPSVKRRDVYDALRRKGYSKEKAARIANATANGTNSGNRGRKGPRGRR
ncbi:hypothetical protein I5G63_gp077 [Mycobacterium phage Imvubu]|uniref:Uncharacterized protein n=1 Tax=Mycobacterium phage Imvubu TaxID=2686233 RepID=A0A6B9LDR2_9CAUD|nr:hypothetical protein I5G63_gp077 [Mycobacterium phage Imvubu]QHB37818.1 hypothetical protein PBI_IMVUBU_77 [Mycobacterium phage Imvubu]